MHQPEEDGWEGSSNGLRVPEQVGVAPFLTVVAPVVSVDHVNFTENVEFNFSQGKQAAQHGNIHIFGM